MNKIIEYHAVSAADDYKKFNEAVNAQLKLGFQPLGGVATSVDENTVYFTQAMVKYERKLQS